MAQRPKSTTARSQSFPIVGIGASAGGLEAFTQLLGALPLDTGLAFVLVQHLAPQHESMLTALLSHTTPLPIQEARDGMVLEPNHIYVIPPNTNLAVLHGRLSLMPRTEARGQHLPVDYFFRSLAADQKARAIGVILSGTASDGTEGLRAIKAEGGLTFSQDEKPPNTMACRTAPSRRASWILCCRRRASRGSWPVWGGIRLPEGGRPHRAGQIHAAGRGGERAPGDSAIPRPYRPLFGTGLGRGQLEPAEDGARRVVARAADRPQCDAKRHNAPARRVGVSVKANGGFRGVNLEVIPLNPTPSSRAACFLVLFEETAPSAGLMAPVAKAGSAKSAKQPGPVARDKIVAQLRQELTATKEYLQSVITEHERTNEELQSANEEILSSNEELQSTNEELTTVNDELHTRNTELGQANNDLVNLLNSVQIPIVMLGGDLRIRRFTPPAERVLNLIPTDVGRPLSDLRPNLVVPEFERLIAGVMDSLTPQEVEVQDREGRWYSLRIRPYRTLENKIDGVILALVDIDTARRALTQAREAQELAEAVVETVGHPLLVLDSALRVRTANRAYYDLFQTRPVETENRFIYNLGQGQWNMAKLRELLEQVLPKNSRLENFEVEVDFPGVGRKRLVLSARRITDEGKKTQWILLAMEEAKE